MQKQQLACFKSSFQKKATKIGYARVSSDEQNLDLQRDALTAAGCDVDQALGTLKEGDVLVTWRLDRLGRSLPNLIELVASLQGKGGSFTSLNEAIDTTSAGGKLIFHIMGALA